MVMKVGTKSMRAEIKAHLVAIRDAATLEAGEAAARELLEKYSAGKRSIPVPVSASVRI